MGDFTTTRRALYNEIWNELSVRAVARKYNLNHTDLLRFVKENNIPTPSRSYVSYVERGLKPKDKKIELLGNPDEVIVLYDRNSLLRHIELIDDDFL